MDKESRYHHQIYSYWLNSLPGIGSKSIQKLLALYGSPKECYHHLFSDKVIPVLTDKQLQSAKSHSKQWDLQGEYDKLGKADIRFVTALEDEYPKHLKEIPDPPFGIFIKGKLPSDKLLSVAMIGARECSEYGKYIAKELGQVLGSCGIQIISGMARGIDGISQMAGMNAGGSSFGVLGCGVDICYPAENKELYHRLIEEGGILSSYPPGTKPQASLFPPRNRIVSGLSDVVVVVEARKKSGTLITVDMALEQGREVYCVPGRITDRLSDGCNQLIKQGAGLLLSTEDFLTDLKQRFPDKGYFERKKTTSIPQSDTASGVYQRKTPGLKTLEQDILKQLDFTPKSVEQIRSCIRSAPTYGQTLQILMRFTVTGMIKQAAPGYFVKRSPDDKAENYGR